MVRSAALDIAGPLDGMVVWDLCCGSGAFGLECLSAGASSCVFVDSSRDCASFVRETLGAFGASDRGRVVCCDARLLDMSGLAPADLVFVDPPYRAGSLLEWAFSFDWGGSAAPGALVMVESASRTEPPAEWKTRRYGDTGLSWRFFG